MNAPSIGFAVAPLTPAIGGLVAGLDLAGPLSDWVVARLKAAVAERHVLFFEGQTLDPAAQRDFAARFGKLHVHPVYPHVDGVPEITSIETRPDDLPDNDNWHTDVTFIDDTAFWRRAHAPDPAVERRRHPVGLERGGLRGAVRADSQAPRRTDGRAQF